MEEGVLNESEVKRQIYGSREAFGKCRKDKKFAYVVALGRAVNALNAAHSLMMTRAGEDSPGALRDRMNGHFFVSGILYESLELIRKMSGIFGGDASFETSLRLVLKDASNKAVEKMHLKAARHGAVFHFLPDRFRDAIAKTPLGDCIFVSSIGERRGEIHYSFADTITAEIMVGGSLQDEKVINEMMKSMLKLVKQLIEHSENFIADQLYGWGFEVKTLS
jgi:hypothetical protein